MSDIDDVDDFDDYLRHEEVHGNLEGEEVEREFFNMSDVSFKKNFRFSKEEVVQLTDLIRENLRDNRGNQRHSPEFQVRNIPMDELKWVPNNVGYYHSGHPFWKSFPENWGTSGRDTPE